MENIGLSLIYSNPLYRHFIDETLINSNENIYSNAKAIDPIRNLFLKILAKTSEFNGSKIGDPLDVMWYRQVIEPRVLRCVAKQLFNDCLTLEELKETANSCLLIDDSKKKEENLKKNINSLLIDYKNYKINKFSEKLAECERKRMESLRISTWSLEAREWIELSSSSNKTELLDEVQQLADQWNAHPIHEKQLKKLRLFLNERLDPFRELFAIYLSDMQSNILSYIDRHNSNRLAFYLIELSNIQVDTYEYILSILNKIQDLQKLFGKDYSVIVDRDNQEKEIAEVLNWFVSSFLCCYRLRSEKEAIKIGIDNLSSRKAMLSDFISTWRNFKETTEQTERSKEFLKNFLTNWIPDGSEKSKRMMWLSEFFLAWLSNADKEPDHFGFRLLIEDFLQLAKAFEKGDTNIPHQFYYLFKLLPDNSNCDPHVPKIYFTIPKTSFEFLGIYPSFIEYNNEYLVSEDNFQTFINIYLSSNDSLIRGAAEILLEESKRFSTLSENKRKLLTLFWEDLPNLTQLLKLSLNEKEYVEAKQLLSSVLQKRVLQIIFSDNEDAEVSKMLEITQSALLNKILSPVCLSFKQIIKTALDIKKKIIHIPIAELNYTLNFLQRLNQRIDITLERFANPKYKLQGAALSGLIKETKIAIAYAMELSKKTEKRAFDSSLFNLNKITKLCKDIEDISANQSKKLETIHLIGKNQDQATQHLTNLFKKDQFIKSSTALNLTKNFSDYYHTLSDFLKDCLFNQQQENLNQVTHCLTQIYISMEFYGKHFYIPELSDIHPYETINNYKEFKKKLRIRKYRLKKEHLASFMKEIERCIKEIFHDKTKQPLPINNEIKKNKGTKIIIRNLSNLKHYLDMDDCVDDIFLKGLKEIERRFQSAQNQLQLLFKKINNKKSSPLITEYPASRQLIKLGVPLVIFEDPRYKYYEEHEQFVVRIIYYLNKNYLEANETKESPWNEVFLKKFKNLLLNCFSLQGEKYKLNINASMIEKECAQLNALLPRLYTQDISIEDFIDYPEIRESSIEKLLSLNNKHWDAIINRTKIINQDIWPFLLKHLKGENLMKAIQYAPWDYLMRNMSNQLKIKRKDLIPNTLSLIRSKIWESIQNIDDDIWKYIKEIIAIFTNNMEIYMHEVLKSPKTDILIFDQLTLKQIPSFSNPLYLPEIWQTVFSPYNSNHTPNDNEINYWEIAKAWEASSDQPPLFRILNICDRFFIRTWNFPPLDQVEIIWEG